MRSSVFHSAFKDASLTLWFFRLLFMAENCMPVSPRWSHEMWARFNFHFIGCSSSEKGKINNICAEKCWVCLTPRVWKFNVDLSFDEGPVGMLWSGQNRVVFMGPICFLLWVVTMLIKRDERKMKLTNTVGKCRCFWRPLALHVARLGEIFFDKIHNFTMLETSVFRRKLQRNYKF